MRYTYSAYDNTTDGHTHEIEGTLEDARRAAIQYARESLPHTDHRGYGPKIVVANPETGERLIEERVPDDEIALLRSVIDASGLSARKWAESVAWRDERTVRRWIAGDSPIPGTVLERLRIIAARSPL